MKSLIKLAFLLAMSTAAYCDGIDDLASTIWDEARGETLQGRRMVASVIWNRGGGSLDGMVKAIKKPYQFSGWNGGGKPSVTISNANDEIIWKECKALAKAMANGTFEPITEATHYHSEKVSPQWKDKLTFVKKVGRHLFYI